MDKAERQRTTKDLALSVPIEKLVERLAKLPISTVSMANRLSFVAKQTCMVFEKAYFK